MTDAPLSITTSVDRKTWTKPANIVNGYSDYGLQMAVYRGEIYGIMTQTVQYPKYLFATKYKLDEGWRSWKSLPQLYRAQGRVSVTVLEDRFYVLYRGTNNGVYLVWTDDFDTWHDIGRVGSVYAKTMVAPAIAAHDGQLFMVGVGEDESIYYTVADKDGTRVSSWKKIDGTGTQSALSMAVYAGRLYLFHTGYHNTKFYYQTLDVDGASKLTSKLTNITSGLSAVSWKYDQIVVTYRGKDEDIKLDAFDGQKWMGKTYVPDIKMRYQLGLTTFGGRLVVSYAAGKDDSSFLSGYNKLPMFMDEKNVFGRARVEEVDDDEEWNCKWDKNNRQSQQKDQGKSMIRKFFCL